jgi:RNA polymerase sigma factor (sigma-70 family)
MSSNSDLSVLLAQTGWARALARSLAADVHQADDLVQDAWVAALERPPDLDRPVRGWIASVLRHRWLDLGRSAARRTDRERAVAVDEAWPSTHDVVERASVLREVVEAVLALDEPYRTTVLLRFFEELPQREIARRMHTSTVTVNSRLTRALAQLRVRLSRGGRTSWLRVLVPLLREPKVPALAVGAIAMKVVYVVSVAVAVSFLAGIALWNWKGEKPRELDSSPVAFEAATTATPADTSRPNPGMEPSAAPQKERIALAAEVARPAPPTTAPPAARIIRGRVLDATGAPLSGIALALSSESSKETCRSDSNGWFEIALDGRSDGILSADPRYATVLAGSARVHGSTQPIVVVAPRIDLAGSVIDALRAPLADAWIELLLPAGFGAEWGVALDFSVPQHWRVRSAADGRFELAAVPAVEGARVTAALAGFAPNAEPSPLASTSALEIVLSHPGGSGGLVRGVVLDPSGARAEGARVSAGAEIALTNARGEFTLDVRREGTRERILAIRAGLLPAIFEPERDAAGQFAWPSEIVMQLGVPAGKITGRVVDAEGNPMGDAKVWLVDPTSFGRAADTRLTVETLLRGDDRFWSFERTKPDGTFAIAGLLARAYRLRAVDPRTLASAESASVTAADSPVELRLPTDDVHEKVAGRVVSKSGQPIRGVNVRLFRITFELQHADGTDNEAEESQPVVTGEDGTFAFRNVPKHGVEVIATGDTILGTSATLEGVHDATHLELVASLRLHLQVEISEPRDRADRLKVFDARDRRVLLSVFHGSGAHASFDMPIRDGRSDVISVADTAATLVLYREEEEVARVPLNLSPGEPNLVRY